MKRQKHGLCKAFALSGRLADCHHTQGDALGYELLGLQPVLNHMRKFSNLKIRVNL